MNAMNISASQIAKAQYKAVQSLIKACGRLTQDEMRIGNYVIARAMMALAENPEKETQVIWYTEIRDAISENGSRLPVTVREITRALKVLNNESVLAIDEDGWVHPADESIINGHAVFITPADYLAAN